jgi:NADH-quinone oxidoreductase subunit C
MNNEELKNFVAAHCPEAVAEENTEWLNVVVPHDKVRDLLFTLRHDPNTELDYLFCLSGVDWKTHFHVVYHLESKRHKHIVVVKAKVEDRNNPEVPTICDIWRTAEFHEREVFDLFGIRFTNHPDLRRLFLDDTWGFPLRKDYQDDVTIVSL